MDPDKILQAYVAKLISCVKILAPWAKGVQNGGKESGCFCNRYSELAFLCNGTD